MGHLIGYNLKLLLSNRTLVFWTLAFPLLLGLLFKGALGDIVNKEAFDTVPVAVVNSQVYQDSTFKIAFDDLSKKDSSPVSSENQPLLKLRMVKTLEEGKQLLEDEEVSGLVEITGTWQAAISRDAKAHLTLASNGVEQTILKTILDEITQRTDMISQLTQREIAENVRAHSPPDFQNIPPGQPPAFDPSQVAASVQEQLAKSGFTLRDRSPKSMDLLMAEFFSLLAMAALYGGMFSMTVMNNAQPPLGVIGRRVAVAPTSKAKLIISGIISSYLLQLVGLILLVAVCHVLFNIDFGPNWALTFLLTSLGALVGLSFGVAISALVPGGENMKIGVLISVTMLGAVLAGMMGGTMRYVVDQKAPLVNKLNPTALITDGFYNLYYHPGFDGFWQDVTLLLIISAVLLGVSLFVLRKQRYDSL
ncbi:MAG: ABC transporter permease [Varibaculum cambriense]|uniref:ABC transporter permease n=1 Tax=Varibaculum cambriense TaxID=184870 RepID=UPI0028FEA300|nr:ABC transporter permease [Varibaculum cambriense]MDU1052113.1 ABC transporter permease [Varibaculum cambriense]